MEIEIDYGKMNTYINERTLLLKKHYTSSPLVFLTAVLKSKLDILRHILDRFLMELFLLHSPLRRNFLKISVDLRRL